MIAYSEAFVEPLIFT